MNVQDLLLYMQQGQVSESLLGNCVTQPGFQATEHEATEMGMERHSWRRYTQPVSQHPHLHVKTRDIYVSWQLERSQVFLCAN
ncbi:hypothetical protein NQZ68_019044 [Dissostichus eleginoides]|nr:hypothetical protein NQZ68_019044 [Dissostichus eleginoides]